MHGASRGSIYPLYASAPHALPAARGLSARGAAAGSADGAAGSLSRRWGRGDPRRAPTLPAVPVSTHACALVDNGSFSTDMLMSGTFEKILEREQSFTPVTSSIQMDNG